MIYKSAVSILLPALLWAFLPSVAHAEPAPAAPAAGASQHSRHVHRRHHASAAATQPPAVAPAADKAIAGTQPAPVPNENVPDVPPGQAPATQVTPSLLQLHYPHVGDGYVQGSSPSAIDDRNASKAPGVEMQMPLK